MARCKDLDVASERDFCAKNQNFCFSGQKTRFHATAKTLQQAKKNPRHPLPEKQRVMADHVLSSREFRGKTRISSGSMQVISFQGHYCRSLVKLN